MPDFIIDSLFPSRRIHLIGGASNVGKTRWILPTMVAWASGKPIMGFRSHPAPWAYVSGDRLLIEALETIKGLALPLNEIQIIPAFGGHNKTWPQVLAEAAKLKVSVLVWEGFGDLVRDPQRRPQVREFLGSISACCAESIEFPNGLTILGIMETPKMRPKDRYQSPRERISGAASWGYHTSSVLMLEATKPEDPSNPSRILFASLKNAPSFTSLGTFTTSGHIAFGLPELVEVMSEQDIDTEIARMKAFLNPQKHS
jgi:hypothetical protein